MAKETKLSKAKSKIMLNNKGLRPDDLTFLHALCIELGIKAVDFVDLSNNSIIKPESIDILINCLKCMNAKKVDLRETGLEELNKDVLENQKKADFWEELSNDALGDFKKILATLNIEAIYN